MSTFVLPPHDVWDYKYNAEIHGTRFLAFKSQRLISTGILSLDNIIGGGMPIGTIMLVEDDDLGIFGKILLKYFFAEGYACNHSLFIGSHDVDSRSLISDLPAACEKENSNVDVPNEDLLFTELNKGSSFSNDTGSLTVIGHNFDLSKTVPQKDISDYDVHHWNISTAHINKEGGSYKDLSLAITKWIAGKGYLLNAKTPDKKRNLLRIGIHNIGSNLWPESQESLTQFFYNLRAIVCNSYSAAMITLPKVLIQNFHLMERCEQLSDCIVRLESLIDSDPLYNEYNGIIRLMKFPLLNTLSAHIPEDSDWGVKLRRRKIVIEKLHLPPELQSTTQREQDDSVLSCSKSISNYLEF